MKMCAIVASAFFCAGVAWGEITVPTVQVGYAGNASDPTRPLTTFGRVDYTYQIGKYEVTNAQYVSFLNSVAATDTHSLYNPEMAGTYGGIIREGTEGSFTYTTVRGRENNPVNFVSFWDATRFSNWMHNNQRVGQQDHTTTERGAYTLTPEGIANNSIRRNSNSRWMLPTDLEWYKAAYFQPESEGGDVDNYWLYPTKSNTISTADANYDWSIGTPRPVGSYSPNFFDTYDMAGNVWEWNEINSATSQGIRGGGFPTVEGILRSSNLGVGSIPGAERRDIGFRLAQAVPGPGVAGVFLAGALCMSKRRRVG